MLNVEYWMLNVEYWMMNVDCWILNIECWLLNVEYFFYFFYSFFFILFTRGQRAYSRLHEKCKENVNKQKKKTFEQQKAHEKA